VESDDTSERLKQLVQIGKIRGYILYDELDGFVPPSLEGDTHLDIVLTELAVNGIEILEEPGDTYDIDLTEDGKIFAEKGLQKLIEEPDNSSAIKMYLRELTTLPRRCGILVQGDAAISCPPHLNSPNWPCNYVLVQLTGWLSRRIPLVRDRRFIRVRPCRLEQMGLQKAVTSLAPF
jgi:hypothetical protein